MIDCSVEIGLKRALRRNKILSLDRQDLFERERRYFHEAVRQGYLSLARGDRKRFVVVDGTLREDELESVIFKYMRPFISREMRVRDS